MIQAGFWIDKLSAYQRLWLCLLVPTAIGLPWLSQQAAYWHDQQQLTQLRLASMDQVRQIEQSAETSLNHWKSTQSDWQQLADQARTQGRAIDLWQSHSVRVNEQRFSRQEADEFLNSLFTNDQALVLPDTFSIKLAEPQGSLLIDSPSADEPKALFITLTGTYYSRRQP